MNGDRRHWTTQSHREFRFAIALDFVDQIEDRMEAIGVTRAGLAKMLGVDKSRVSQLLNNPGNLSLDVMVRCVVALELKLSLLAYDDGDPANVRGPVNSAVFRKCWEDAGRPVDMWEGVEGAQLIDLTGSTVSTGNGHDGESIFDLNLMSVERSGRSGDVEFTPGSHVVWSSEVKNSNG